MATRSAEAHYDDAYFAWQSAAGDVQGRANAFKFQPYVRAGDRILDFGCGSGALLRALGGTSGVEINPKAIQAARDTGLDVRRSLVEFDSGSFDIVVSNHALEHVEDPLAQVREMHRVLAPGGRVVIVVPSERASQGFSEADINQHLYTWSAGNLGNLLKVAGFRVEESREIIHRWPPKWQLIQRVGVWTAFHAASRVWGRISRSVSRVRRWARSRPERSRRAPLTSRAKEARTG